jgi:rfaE bifunctional protein nucleotidyltransferase chain/domain/rfaE bifunctional protein kinase chain/domain
MSRRIVVVGDLLLDRDVEGRTERIAPDAPVPVLDVERTHERPGGAGLTALLCAEPAVGRPGPAPEVLLVAPVADDEAGRRLTGLLTPHLEVLPLPHHGPTRTKTRIRSAGQSLVRLDEGGPGTTSGVPEAELARALAGADVVLVSDYGAGTTTDPVVRRLLEQAATRTPMVWDPHPRGGTPVAGCTVVTPNRSEAVRAAGGGLGGGAPDELAEHLRRSWPVQAVCVTAGADGAYLAGPAGEPMYLPAPPVVGGDPCGAGDRFAASLARALSFGAVLSEAVTEAVVDASGWVAAGGAAAFRPGQSSGAAPAQVFAGHPSGADLSGRRPGLEPPADAGADAESVLARVQGRGGTVVATGGCFDLLHVGHVACLQAARRAGDALIVLLNSDASVRRLKGPGRPVTTGRERARVLAALACVDAVVEFDEDDPRTALRRLRPDVWAKGGDYGGAELPEAALVRSWGGRVLLLPYLSGRSTTALLAGPAAAELDLDPR